MEDAVISGAKLERSESDGKHAQPTHHNPHAVGIEKIHSREDFKKYFMDPEMFANFREKCIYGEMGHQKCRWSSWRAFLGIFEVGDETKIRAKVKHGRDAYYKELDKYSNLRTKQKLNAQIDNPLSTDTNNPWNSFFEDNQLKSDIKKDVDRTYQDIEFFFTKQAQDILTNILFVWAKQNPDLSYKQGMNELVGTLMIVCFTENFSTQNADKDIYDFLNDEKHAEADIYVVYKKIMELNQKEMYRYSINSNDPKKKGAKPAANDNNRPNLPVVNRAVHIQDELLPQVYPELSKHLTKMGVEPQVYMIRWIRCMLSREFRLSQSLVVWDALFSYHSKNNSNGQNLHFLDYMCVSMLIYVSDQLLDRDDSGMIMGRLIRYPPVEDVLILIRLAHEDIVPILKGLKKAGSNAKGLFKAKHSDKKPSNQKTRDDDESSPDAKVILFGSGIPSATTVKKEEPKVKVVKVVGDDDVLSNPLARGNVQSKQTPPPVVQNKGTNVNQKLIEENEKALQNINEIIQQIKQENEKSPSTSLADVLTKLNETQAILKNQSDTIKSLK